MYKFKIKTTLMKSLRVLLACISINMVNAAYAVEVDFKPIAEDIYAYIGDTDGRTYENEGLNANIGLILIPSNSI